MGSDPTYLIGLDWGTTSLRAYRIAKDGTILEERGGGRGIMQVVNGDFASALRDCCGDWLAAHPATQVVASGMIGSKQGWTEAPYCPCPASAAALAALLKEKDRMRGKRVGVILTGGNIDMPKFASALKGETPRERCGRATPRPGPDGPPQSSRWRQ